MNVLSIVLIVLFFGLLIAIHEFGHFIAAKALGVKVNEFAIGMGPKVLSREKGETLYTLRAFPIGGFCAMEGEGESSDDPRAFSNKVWWKKLIILVAGAFMNFVAGVVLILVIFFMAGSPAMPVVTGFMAGAEDVAQTGLLPGDQLYSIDGHRIYFQTNAFFFLERAGEQVEVEVLRDGARVDLGTISLPYRQLVDENGNQVEKRGVYVGQFQADTPLTLLRNVWYQAVDYVRMVWIGLGDLAAAGLFGLLVNILDFTALIAINLAVMNLLPIPALDGGQILFLLVGGIYRLFTGKKINETYLGYINTAGFICLIILMVVVAVNDVIKLF